MFRYENDGSVRQIAALATGDYVHMVLPRNENVVIVSRSSPHGYGPFTVHEVTPEGSYVRQVVIDAANSVSLKTTAIAPNGRIDLLLHDEVGQFGVPSDLIVSTPAF